MRVGTLFELVRVHESIFALPWALASALLAFFSLPNGRERMLDPLLWLWIIIAFVSARTAAMCFNRLIDIDVDRENPRTAHRLIPSGRVSVREATLVTWGFVAVFIYACWSINFLCFLLSPFIVFLLWGYSYTKRFTSLTHFVLGLVEFFAPVMAWIAVTGSLDWPPVLLGLAFLFSIAGTDIIYQMMDVEFDRSRYGVYNLPVCIGTKRSLKVSRGCHVLAVLFLFDAAYWSGAHWIFFLSVPIAAWIYFDHHRLIKEEDIPANFFRCNSWVGISVFLCACGALLCHVL